MKQINLIAAVLLAIFSTACVPGESGDASSILSSRYSTVIDTPSQDCPYCVQYNLNIDYPSSETARTNLFNKLFACGEDISGLDMGELSKRIIDRASMEDISFLEELWPDHKQTGYRYVADTLSHSFDCSFLGNVRGYDNMEYTEEIFLGTAHPDISCKHVVLDSKGYVCALEDVLKPGSVSGLTPVAKQSAEDFLNGFGAPVSILEDVDFYLSKDFYFNEDGIVFYYDKGTFGGWAIPAIEACIPWEKIENYLSEQ